MSIKQIDSFFNTKENKNDSKKIGEKYFYVDSVKAGESAEFFKYLVQEKNIQLNSNLNVMDLCFGSANLTAHIVLDNKLDVTKLYLNDIDTKVTNQNITIDNKSEILDFDFLDFRQFNGYANSIDILVFNPTISDSDIHRKISIKENDRVIIFNNNLDIKVSFIDYCKNLSLKVIGDIKIDRINKTIKVEIEGTKKVLDTLPNSFNDYSLICKTKNMQKYENRSSVVTQINQTISTILKKDGIVVFVGTNKQRETIFQNYNTVFRYLRDDNDVFIIQKSGQKLLQCFENIENKFIENDDCEIKKLNEKPPESFDDITVDIDDFLSDKTEAKKEETPMKEIEKNKIDNKKLGNIKFTHKNILLKGVPGTGKSKTIDNIIEKNLEMSKIPDNVLRINIHSASSNSDLMQGISISTNDNNDILYEEKKGAVLNHIFKAMYKPNQPFVLVLEEIQENSLNELIGDLIYLIEKDKRTLIALDNEQELSYEELFSQVNPKYFVELPNLVENSESNTKMIMPDNLYVFCTSNYRDDRKVIEDNLLRRFDVVEIYPKYFDESWVDGNGELIFKSEDISKFLEKLNGAILKQFGNETHPDRYLVGHANWLNIEKDDEALFYTALLKVIIEFKEIREVDFNSYVKPILQKLFKKDDELSDRIKTYLEDFYDYKEDKLKLNSYKSLVEKLQAKIYSDFL
jgi:hypothetical protein